MSGNIVVSGTVDGADVAQMNSKLSGIEDNADVSPSINATFTGIKGLDGTGSGLDADLLDGQHGNYYQQASTAITTSNIASQSVASAASATTASQLGGVAAASYARSDASLILSMAFLHSAANVNTGWR